MILYHFGPKYDLKLKYGSICIYMTNKNRIFMFARVRNAFIFNYTREKMPG
jgi:hypothetical protein